MRKSTLPKHTPGLSKGLVVKVWEHVPPQLPNVSPPLLGLIGEAPSNIEKLKGQPLVGPAGQILNQVLRTANIERASLYIDNVFDEQLPENDIANWCAPAAERKTWENYDLPMVKGAGFLRPEFAWHLDALRKRIEEVKPKILVPLGGTALWAFTGSNAITPARGALGSATNLLPGYPILPTFHPEFIRHVFKMFHVMVGDLRKALQVATGEYHGTEHEIWIDPKLSDLEDFEKRYIQGAEILSVDIETGGGQIKSVGIGVDRHRAIVVPFVDFRNPSRSYWLRADEEVDAIGWIERVMALPIPKLFQYGQYDVYWLQEKWGIRVVNWCEDTRLAHHALYPEMPKDLGFMGASYTSNPAWKTMREKISGKRDE